MKTKTLAFSFSIFATLLGIGASVLAIVSLTTSSASGVLRTHRKRQRVQVAVLLERLRKGEKLSAVEMQAVQREMAREPRGPLARAGRRFTSQETEQTVTTEET